jgi:hypothetical protein
MDVVDKLYSNYGKRRRSSSSASRLKATNLNAAFPELDYVKRAVITK